MDKNDRPNVLSIYPSGKLWPANVLRAHVLFSQPMEVAGAIQHIRLLDSENRDISNALLDLPDGLWTTDQRILTVLFHPGRIKTGLSAIAQYDSVFSVGCSYRFLVSSQIRSAEEQAMEHDYVHSFQIGPPIKESLTLRTQKTPLPDREIRIETNQPLDFLSAQMYLGLFDEFSRRAAAQFCPSPDGKAAVARVSESLSKQKLLVQAHSLLEDVAGNRMAAPFEARRAAARRVKTCCGS